MWLFTYRYVCIRQTLVLRSNCFSAPHQLMRMPQLKPAAQPVIYGNLSQAKGYILQTENG